MIALRTASVSGEESGALEQVDFDAFIASKSRRSQGPGTPPCSVRESIHAEDRVPGTVPGTRAEVCGEVGAGARRRIRLVPFGRDLVGTVARCHREKGSRSRRPQPRSRRRAHQGSGRNGPCSYTYGRRHTSA
jgi:hypothetical protein